MTEDYDALSQKHLASLKRDTRVSLEDATVRATHKVMSEFNPDWDEKAVLVEEMQRMAKRIGELEQKVAARSAEHLAAHITHDKGYQEGRQDAQLDQALERNFCPRCGKRRGGDVNYIHTCTPPARGTMFNYTPRTFDDYGNKIS